MGLIFQKENGESGEGPEEVCQDGVRSLKHELYGESEGTGPLWPAEREEYVALVRAYSYLER